MPGWHSLATLAPAGPLAPGRAGLGSCPQNIHRKPFLKLSICSSQGPTGHAGLFCNTPRAFAPGTAPPHVFACVRRTLYVYALLLSAMERPGEGCDQLVYLCPHDCSIRSSFVRFNMDNQSKRMAARIFATSRWHACTTARQNAPSGRAGAVPQRGSPAPEPCCGPLVIASRASCPHHSMCSPADARV